MPVGRRLDPDHQGRQRRLAGARRPDHADDLAGGDLEADVGEDRPVHALDRIGHVFDRRSEEHTSELQSLMRISYAVFCLKKNNITTQTTLQQRQYKKKSTAQNIKDTPENNTTKL